MATSLSDKSQFTVKASVGKNTKTDKKEKSKINPKVLHCIVALLNSFGGTLTVLLNDGYTREDVLRPIEQQIGDKSGHITASKRIHTVKRDDEEIIFELERAFGLVTLNFNLFVATETQIVAVSPLDRIDEILQHSKASKASELKKEDYYRNYSIGENIGKESKTRQFKKLKSEPRKSSELFHRMKKNKFENTFSAFANTEGGSILYGINDSGEVEGQHISKQEKQEVIVKVTEVIEKMIWSPTCKKLERYKQWDIAFKPVKDQKGNEIVSLYVIDISVVRCPGGVFIARPESYHVVKNEVKPMEFNTWWSKFFRKERDGIVACKRSLEKSANEVPKNIKRTKFSSDEYESCYNSETKSGRQVSSSGRSLENRPTYQVCEVPKKLNQCKWSSAKCQSKYSECTIMWERLRKSGEWKLVASLSKEINFDLEGKLVNIFQRTSVAIMQGKLDEAQQLFQQFCEERTSTSNVHIFALDAIYLQLVLYRYQENFQASLEVADEGLRQMELVEPCLTTAWLLSEIGATYWNHACSTSSVDPLLAKSEFDKAKQSFERSIEQARNLASVEASCDIQGKVWSMLAMVDLKTPLNGCNLEGSPIISKEQIDNVVKYLAEAENLSVECTPLNYNRCLRHLVECNVNYQQSRIDPDQSPNFLKKATKSAKMAKKVAQVNQFKEFRRHASHLLKDLNAVQQLGRGSTRNC